MISLDPIHYKIVIGAQKVELQPLTFGLFAKLLEHKNQIVAISVLTDEVWGDVTVSPDTLKQRIFLLRKALEVANVEGCSVQSVRGQGYRLVVPEEERASGFAVGRRLAWALGTAATLVLAAIYAWQPYNPPPNSRIVFWETSPTSVAQVHANEWEQQWMTQLSSSEKVIFVAAERDPAQSISGQARQTSAALISAWTLFESDGRQWVRMQIIEPKTTSTLRSDLAALDDSDEMSRLLAAQRDALERILESGPLPLLSESLNDTDHPAWDELRNLASDPN